MAEHIDPVAYGSVLRDETIAKAGDVLIASVVLTSTGRLTAAEALVDCESLITKLYRKS